MPFGIIPDSAFGFAGILSVDVFVQNSLLGHDLRSIFHGIASDALGTVDRFFDVLLNQQLADIKLLKLVDLPSYSVSKCILQHPCLCDRCAGCADLRNGPDSAHR